MTHALRDSTGHQSSSGERVVFEALQETAKAESVSLTKGVIGG